jgi:uncharacterized protein (TIGR02466 family)
MEYKMIPTFSTPILNLQKFIDDKEFIQKFTDYILEEERSTKTRSEAYSLKGKNGWHGPDDLSTKESPIRDQLNKYILDVVNMYMQQIGSKETYDLENTHLSTWAMVMRSNDYSSTHTHPYSDISGCLYLQVPENMPDSEGNLVLLDPRGGARGSKLFGSSALYFKPSVGNMIVFPSWVDHYVQPHEEGLRMSIAWNALFKGPRD